MRILLAALSLALLGACGFQPVYSGASGYTGSSAIRVDKIPGRSGYILRQNLQKELAVGLPGVENAGTLSVNLKEDLTRLAFKADGAAARSSIVAKGSYLFTADGTKDISGSLQTEVPFAVPDTPYADVSAQTSASDRAARMLAKAIVDDLRLKLSTD